MREWGSTGGDVRVGIIVNPKHARTNRAYSHLVLGFKNCRVHYRSVTTTAEEEGAWQAEHLRAWGADIVIILGGDGTIRASAPGLAAADIPVLLIPTGTANVLSRHVGIRSRPTAVEFCSRVVTSMASNADGSRTTSAGTASARTTSAGTVSAVQRRPETGVCAVRKPELPAREIRVPVNTADYLTDDGLWHTDSFISLAGIGGDARAVAGHGRAPGLLGYMIGAGSALFAPNLVASIGADPTEPTNRQPVRSADATGSHEADEQAITGRERLPVWSVMAGKAARPAGAIPVFPRAGIDGEGFEILTVGPLSTTLAGRLGEWSGIALDCLRGRHEQNPRMLYTTGTALSVKCERPAPAQLDGDLIGDCRELRLRAGQLRLRVLAPAT